MPNESFFMAMGALGVSLAGFAGLIAALDRSSGRSPIAAYRITGIVFQGLSLTVAGFATIAAYTITGENLTLTIQIATVLLTAPLIRGFLQARPGPAWPRERERWIVIGGLSVLTLATLANVYFASLGYLMVLLMAALLGPIQIFYNTVRDAAREAPATAPAVATPEPSSD